jgi:hypothetical protein
VNNHQDRNKEGEKEEVRGRANRPSFQVEDIDSVIFDINGVRIVPFRTNTNNERKEKKRTKDTEEEEEEDEKQKGCGTNLVHEYTHECQRL